MVDLEKILRKVSRKIKRSLIKGAGRKAPKSIKREENIIEEIIEDEIKKSSITPFPNDPYLESLELDFNNPEHSDIDDVLQFYDVYLWARKNNLLKVFNQVLGEYGYDYADTNDEDEFLENVKRFDNIVYIWQTKYMPYFLKAREEATPDDPKLKEIDNYLLNHYDDKNGDLKAYVSSIYSNFSVSDDTLEAISTNYKKDPPLNL